MTKQIDDLLMQLADAIYADQHPETPVDPVTGTEGPKYNAYALGQYIFSVSVDQTAGTDVTAEIFTQWPRLHYWILQAQDDGKKLNFEDSYLDASQVLVAVFEEGSNLKRKAFVTRQVMLDMLSERDVPATERDAANELWHKVLQYECL